MEANGNVINGRYMVVNLSIGGIVEVKGVTKITTIHPVGNMNVFKYVFPNSCQDISLKNKNVMLMVVLEKFVVLSLPRGKLSGLLLCS